MKIGICLRNEKGATFLYWFDDQEGPAARIAGTLMGYTHQTGETVK